MICRFRCCGGPEEPHMLFIRPPSLECTATSWPPPRCGRALETTTSTTSSVTSFRSPSRPRPEGSPREVRSTIRSYLIDGHHGTSSNFDPATHLKSESDGRAAAILKEAGPHGGTIYVVSGTGGGFRPGGAFAHPVMVPFPASGAGGRRVRGITEPGSFLLEIDGAVLTGTQISVTGGILDRFQMEKARR